MADYDKKVTIKKVQNSDTYHLFPKTTSDQVIMDPKKSLETLDVKISDMEDNIESRSLKTHRHDNAKETTDGFMSKEDFNKLKDIEKNANNYKLPKATSTELGGVMTGDNITNNSGVISVNKDNIVDALGYTPADADDAGKPGGSAPLGDDGKVPSEYLPSYVDDILEGYLYNGVFYKDKTHRDEYIPENGKIYTDLDTNKIYRWSGSGYTVVSETLALGITNQTAFRGDWGQEAYDHSKSPHSPADAQKNVQSDWKQNDIEADDYIKNKPGIASLSEDGFMSKADREKLDSITYGAGNYEHPTHTPQPNGFYKVTVDALGHVEEVKNVVQSDITALDIATTSVATSGANGLMSSSDKAKLDGIQAGAAPYTHPSYTARTEDLYRITVDNKGHVDSVKSITKGDIGSKGFEVSSTVDVNFGTSDTAKDATTVDINTSATSNNQLYLVITKHTVLANKSGSDETMQVYKPEAVKIEGSDPIYMTVSKNTNTMVVKHAITAGNKHIPSGGTKGQVLTHNGTSGTAEWASIPTATNNKLGTVIVGENITLNSGTISIDKDNVISALGYTPANVANAIDVLPDATKNDKGVVQIGNNIEVSSGVISVPEASSSKTGVLTSTMYDKLDKIDYNANNYTLPAATGTTLGGVKSGGDVTISNGIIAVKSIEGNDIKYLMNYTNLSNKPTSLPNPKYMVLRTTASDPLDSTYYHDSMYNGQNETQISYFGFQEFKTLTELRQNKYEGYFSITNNSNRLNQTGAMSGISVRSATRTYTSPAGPDGKGETVNSYSDFVRLVFESSSTDAIRKSEKIKLYYDTYYFYNYKDTGSFDEGWLTSTPDPITISGDVTYKLSLSTSGDYITLTGSDGSSSQVDLSKFSFDLPVASKTTLGGVKIGDNLSIGADGKLSATDQTEWCAKAEHIDTTGYHMGTFFPNAAAIYTINDSGNSYEGDPEYIPGTGSGIMITGDSWEPPTELMVRGEGGVFVRNSEYASPGVLQWNKWYQLASTEYVDSKVSSNGASKEIYTDKGVVLGRLTGSTIGTNSYGMGYNVTASGDYSHAEGFTAKATKQSSHAEGCLTEASGLYSHAEGHFSKATANSSHAEGSSTATAEGAHAEGVYTLASGVGSHAEGCTPSDNSDKTGESLKLEASGKASHAEGYVTFASGMASHAEGYHTVARDEGSHSEGGGTEAIGSRSHAEGNDTIAGAFAAHAEGADNVAMAEKSHAEGYNGGAYGEASHSEGYQTMAKGIGSHSEGGQDDITETVNGEINYIYTTASGNYSHAEGSATRATGTASHTEGILTYARGDAAHAEGYDTITYTNYCHAEGWGTQAGALLSGYSAAHAEGRKTIAGYAYSHAEGFRTQAMGVAANSEGSSILNGTDETTSETAIRLEATGKASHAEGMGTHASGIGSHAEGYATLASGQYSHAEGSSDVITSSYTMRKQLTASGKYSHAEGYGTVSSGNAAHAEGYYNTASGDYSHAEGYYSHAQGVGSHAEGFANTDTDAYCSHAEGFASANGKYSHAEGSETYAYGEASHSEGSSNYYIQEDYTGYYENQRWNDANGDFSHTEGAGNTADGMASHAEGYYNVAGNFASHVGGKYSKAMTSTGTFTNQLGDAFVIGNGYYRTSTSPYLSNAFRVTYAGTIHGNLSATTGADYAEFIYEWYDGNPNNEDRVGYFVTIKDEKLYIANEGDYIAGIISGAPSVVGNADEDYYWKYERDEFSRIVWEDLEEEIETVDEETGEKIREKTGRMIPKARMKLSDKYDPSKQEYYTERKDRPEWDYVGMLGVLPVRDDGTCKKDGWCKCNSNGIATLATERGFDTYRVIERVNDHVVKVVLK